MSIFAFLMAAVGPLVVQGLIALAFTTVTFVGVSTLLATLVSSAQSSWASMPLTVLQLAALSGIPEVLGITLAAYAARAAMWAATGAKKYVLKS